MEVDAKIVGGTPGAHQFQDFRYSPAEADQILSVLVPSQFWIIQKRLRRAKTARINRLLIDRVTTGARHFIRDTLEGRMPSPKPDQIKHLEQVRLHSTKLMELLTDTGMFGTPADILLTISKLRHVPKDIHLLKEIHLAVAAIMTASIVRLNARTDPDEAIDHRIRDKKNYLRFRLSCWLIRELESVASKKATKWIDEGAPHRPSSPAVKFLVAAMNPPLVYVGKREISDETARDQIRQVHACWRSGVHPEDPNFHTMVGEKSPSKSRVSFP